MTKRILVAVDLSDASMQVLKEGRALASARGAQMAVVHVAPVFTDVQVLFPQNYAVNMTHALEAEQIARESFEKRVTAVDGCGDVELFFERGTPYAEIVRRAETWSADLIMVGSHGQTGLSRALLGSVAARVARHAHCAVLISRSKPGRSAVLAATDLSDPSLPAIRAAIAEAQVRGVSVAAVHVHEYAFAAYDSHFGALLGNPLLLPSSERQKELRDKLSEKLEAAMRSAGGSGRALVLDGEVVPTIVRSVEDQAAALLVVGTHGRTGLSRILLGSVAEQLIQLADCSVLVVRQEG